MNISGRAQAGPRRPIIANAKQPPTVMPKSAQSNTRAERWPLRMNNQLPRKMEHATRCQDDSLPKAPRNPVLPVTLTAARVKRPTG